MTGKGDAVCIYYYIQLYFVTRSIIINTVRDTYKTEIRGKEYKQRIGILTVIVYTHMICDMIERGTVTRHTTVLVNE